MWITRTLVLLNFSCYDGENTRKDVLSMALLTDELLLESYQKATELQLDREFIALLLAEIRKRELELTAPSVLH
ncbi:sporulation inhibitor A [Paenibacillus sp. oral taxon 786 str. D14]|nr:sporulation inhibitor A [Paenibacillus sp. oral taxon 786 str. D14]